MTTPLRALRMHASRGKVELTLMTDRIIWRVRRRELVARESVQLVFPGGTLRRKSLSYYGTQTERAVQDLHVDNRCS